MSFLRTEYIMNGDIEVPFYIYLCDITGEEIPENFQYYSFCNDTFHISSSGVEYLIEEESRFMNSGMKHVVPLFLHNLLEMYTTRRVRSTYINMKLRKDVLKKYKHTCQYCEAKDNLTIDHIKPVSKGGLTKFDNLQVLCKSCNSKKGAKWDNK